MYPELATSCPRISRFGYRLGGVAVVSALGLTAIAAFGVALYALMLTKELEYGLKLPKDSDQPNLSMIGIDSDIIPGNVSLIWNAAVLQLAVMQLKNEIQRLHMEIRNTPAANADLRNQLKNEMQQLHAELESKVQQLRVEMENASSANTDLHSQMKNVSSANADLRSQMKNEIQQLHAQMINISAENADLRSQLKNEVQQLHAEIRNISAGYADLKRKSKTNQSYSPRSMLPSSVLAMILMGLQMIL